MTVISVVLGVTMYFIVDALQQFMNPRDETSLVVLRVLQGLFVLALVPGMFQMYHYISSLVFTPPLYMTNLPIFLVGFLLAAVAASIKNAPLYMFIFWLATFYLGCFLAFMLTQRIARADGSSVRIATSKGQILLKGLIFYNSSMLQHLYIKLSAVSFIAVAALVLLERFGKVKPEHYPITAAVLGVVYLLANLLALGRGMVKTAETLLIPTYKTVLDKNWKPIWAIFINIDPAENSASRSPRNGPSAGSSSETR